MKKRYILAGLVALCLTSMGYHAINRMVNPEAYAEMDRRAALAESEAQSAIALKDEMEDQAVLDTARAASMDAEVNAAALAMFKARTAYPLEANNAAIRDYNRNLASAIRRWERAQEARHGSQWRATYIMENRLSTCGLGGGDRMDCMEAPMSYAGIPTVENSMALLINEEAAPPEPVGPMTVAAVEEHSDARPEIATVEPGVAIIISSAPQYALNN